MKKLIFVAVAVVASVFLAGCKEETKSADWWASHPKEATEKYLECKKTGEESVNCQNITRVNVRIAREYEPMMQILKEEADTIKKSRGLVY